LPSNLRPTTSKCLHLVTRGLFRSRDKDGSHTTQSAIAKHMLHANFMALCLIEPALLPIEVLHCGNRDFRPYCSSDLRIRTWLVFSGYIMDVQIYFLRQGFRKLLPDTHTDRHDRNYIPRRFTGGQKW